MIEINDILELNSHAIEELVCSRVQRSFRIEHTNTQARGRTVGTTIKNPPGVQTGSKGLKRRTSGQAPVLAGVLVVTQIFLSKELLPQRAW